MDDSIIVSTEEFLAREEEESKAFRSEPKTHIGITPTMFKGVEFVKIQDGTIKVTQEKKIGELKIPTTEEGFRSHRTLVQYIGVSCQPDICATDQLIAPTNAKFEGRQLKSLRTAINHIHETKDSGLDFVRLDTESVHIVGLSNASFANTAGLKSQLSFVVLMVNRYRRENMVHYG